MRRRSVRNPPSAGYERPLERKFYVWQDRVISYGTRFAAERGREVHPWRWLCTMCDPPVAGFRCQKGAWEKIMTVSMPRHFLVRHYHHAWVARNRG